MLRQKGNAKIQGSRLGLNVVSFVQHSPDPYDAIANILLTQDAGSIQSLIDDELKSLYASKYQNIIEWYIKSHDVDNQFDAIYDVICSRSHHVINLLAEIIVDYPDDYILSKKPLSKLDKQSLIEWYLLDIDIEQRPEIVAHLFSTVNLSKKIMDVLYDIAEYVPNYFVEMKMRLARDNNKYQSFLKRVSAKAVKRSVESALQLRDDHAISEFMQAQIEGLPNLACYVKNHANPMAAISKIFFSGNSDAINALAQIQVVGTQTALEYYLMAIEDKNRATAINKVFSHTLNGEYLVILKKFFMKNPHYFKKLDLLNDNALHKYALFLAMLNQEKMQSPLTDELPQPSAPVSCNQQKRKYENIESVPAHMMSVFDVSMEPEKEIDLNPRASTLGIMASLSQGSNIAITNPSQAATNAPSQQENTGSRQEQAMLNVTTTKATITVNNNNYYGFANSWCGFTNTVNHPIAEENQVMPNQSYPQDDEACLSFLIPNYR